MPIDYQALVDSVDAAILKAMESGGVQEYQIAGRGLKRYTLKELCDMRDKYQSMLNRQKGQSCINIKPMRYRGNRFGC